jgi:methionyl aminopeptidase
MRIAGQLTAKVLEAVTEIIKPGITTMQIDEFCEDYICNTLHAIPGSKGQYGYPYSVNTSVNQVICHGMPSSKQILVNGDIVNVDITVIHEGYYGDSSKMFCIGKVASHAQRLVDVTQQCLYYGISVVKPGASLGDIGFAIQSHAFKNHYTVVREYCGHGIGQQMHEEPQVMHYGSPNSGMKLQAGMTFTIEPMINQGQADVKHLVKHYSDQEKTILAQLSSQAKMNLKYSKTTEWPIAQTKDRKLSAQWEHTVLVTEEGVEVLTMREEEKQFLSGLDK